MLKICSWNINGIRSFSKPIKYQLDRLNSDLICFQETKATRQLSSEFCLVNGYNAYFSNCTSRPGYSGVCVFCRDPVKPYVVIDGLNVLPSPQSSSPHYSAFEYEGRAIVLKFKLSDTSKDLSILCVYCPRVEPGNKERSDYKREFLHRLQSCIYSLISEGSYVAVAGDLNICHSPIDHCSLEDYNISDGESRDWLKNILRSHSGENSDCRKIPPLHDIFRLAHPTRTNAFSCWKSSTGARITNYGTRIDYILFSDEMVLKFGSADLSGVSDLMVDVEGSDHCPLWAKIPITVEEVSHESLCGSLHPLCTAFWPQCIRRQLCISDFLKPYTIQAPVEVDSQKRRQAVSDCHVIKKPKQTQLNLVFRKSIKSDSEVPNLSEMEEDSAQDRSSSVMEAKKNTIATAAAFKWSQIFRPTVIPKCSGHCEPCVKRKVKRASKNLGREFWTCARPEGAPGNPEARCSTFIWSDSRYIFD